MVPWNMVRQPEIPRASPPASQVRGVIGNCILQGPEALFDAIYAASLTDIEISARGHYMFTTTVKNYVSLIRHKKQLVRHRL